MQWMGASVGAYRHYPGCWEYKGPAHKSNRGLAALDFYFVLLMQVIADPELLLTPS